MTSLRTKAARLRSVEVDGPSGAMPDGTGFRASHHAPAGHGHTASIPIAEHEPTYRLDALIAQRRAEIGEDRWQRLNEEWNAA